MHRYGLLVYHFRWLTVTFWLAAVLVSVPFALKSPSVLQGGGYFNISGQAADAQSILSQQLHQPLSQVVVVFQSATAPVTDPVYQREVRAFAVRARTFPSTSPPSCPAARARTGARPTSLSASTMIPEELGRARPPDRTGRDAAISEAVAATIATAGRAILFSGIIVMIGFLGLLAIGIQITTSFAIGGAVVVAIAVLAALTLLPALLSILGTRVNAVRIPFLERRPGWLSRPVAPGGRGFWHAWALAVKACTAHQPGLGSSASGIKSRLAP